MRKKKKQKQIMPFRTAVELVDPELSDEQFWAMAHEIAGIEYGEGFEELWGDNAGGDRKKGTRS